MALGQALMNLGSALMWIGGVVFFVTLIAYIFLEKIDKG